MIGFINERNGVQIGRVEKNTQTRATVLTSVHLKGDSMASQSERTKHTVLKDLSPPDNCLMSPC